MPDSVTSTVIYRYRDVYVHAIVTSLLRVDLNSVPKDHFKLFTDVSKKKSVNAL